VCTAATAAVRCWIRLSLGDMAISGLEGDRVCQASGGRAAHRQASLISWICGVKYLSDFYRRSHTPENVSAVYALEWHNPFL
jgi:hypothetical protein